MSYELISILLSEVFNAYTHCFLAVLHAVIADYVRLFSFIDLSFLLYPYSNLDHFDES